MMKLCLSQKIVRFFSSFLKISIYMFMFTMYVYLELVTYLASLFIGY